MEGIYNVKVKKSWKKLQLKSLKIFKVNNLPTNMTYLF